MINSSTAAYSSAHFGKSLIWNFFNTFFLFFAIYGLGLAPLPASAVAFAFATTDAAFDIPAAILIHKRSKRTRQMANWVTMSTPVCSFFLFLTFIELSKSNSALSIGFCIAAGFTCRIAFTFIDVPLNSSIGRFNYNSKQRNIVAGWRSIGSVSAAIGVAVLLAIFVENANGIDANNLWKPALVIALIAPLAIIPSFKLIDNRAGSFEHRGSDSSVLELLNIVRRNITRNFLILLLINISSLFLITQFYRGIIFIVENDPFIRPSFSAVWSIMIFATAVTVAPWMIFASRNEKRFTAITLLLLLLIIVASYPVLKASQFGVFCFSLQVTIGIP